MLLATGTLVLIAWACALAGVRADLRALLTQHVQSPLSFSHQLLRSAGRIGQSKMGPRAERLGPSHCNAFLALFLLFSHAAAGPQSPNSPKLLWRLLETARETQGAGGAGELLRRLPGECRFSAPQCKGSSLGNLDSNFGESGLQDPVAGRGMPTLCKSCVFFT